MSIEWLRIGIYPNIYQMLDGECLKNSLNTSAMNFKRYELLNLAVKYAVRVLGRT
jgi:hypothetical protein